MCGISGVLISNSSDFDRNKEEELVGMVKAQYHRGPDFNAYSIHKNVGLGHNRLSIIDLSSEANQPFFYKHLMMVYNGEVYNYLELKEELVHHGFSFTTSSDTEVIMAAYLHWGRSCVQKFVGMWSFAIYDKQEEELFCSVDRFGIKPFYYFIDDSNTFYFASEVKAFYHISSFKKAINAEQCMRYVKLGWMKYKNETFFQNCFSLPSAHNLVLKNGKILTEDYWEIDYTKSSLDDEVQIEKFKDLFLSSVKLHMRSDVDVAFSLSGGIDSSSIVSVAAKESLSEKQLNIFNVHYNDEAFSEKKWVKKVTEKYKDSITENYKIPNEEDIKSFYKRFVYHQDFPVSGSSTFSQYFLNKEVKANGIKVLIEGQGADEYLGGYLHSIYSFLVDENLSGFFEQFGKYKENQNLNMKQTIIDLAKFFVTKFKNVNKMYQFEFTRVAPNLFMNEDIKFEFENKGKTRLDNYLFALTRNSTLSTLLHIADRNSMAFSVEARVPFLDHRLFEMVASTKNRLKIDKGVTKKILREAIKEYLPKEIYNRYDKVGFVTPGETKWLRGELKFLVDEFNINIIPNLNKNIVNKLLTKYKEGDDSHAKVVWRLVNLSYWLGKVGYFFNQNIKVVKIDS